nr:Acylphosphatase-1 [Polyrhizophydium stewartii]
MLVDKSAQQIEELNAQISKLERERNERNEQHTRDIEHKTAQWSSIAKHKEMEYQNALRQRDNQMSALKKQIQDLEFRVKQHQQQHQQQPLRQADSAPQQRRPSSRQHLPSSSSGVPAHAALREIEMTKSVGDAEADIGADADEIIRQLDLESLMHDLESETNNGATPVCPPPRVSEKPKRASRPARSSRNVSIVHETTTTVHKKVISSSSLANRGGKTAAADAGSVFFRKHAQKQAQALGLVGFVRNTPDGTVVGTAQGPLSSIAAFKAWVSTKGSPKSAISRCDFTHEATIDSLAFGTFDIQRD